MSEGKAKKGTSLGDTDDQHSLEDALKQAQGAFDPEDLAELSKTSPEIAALLSPGGETRAATLDSDSAPAAPVTKPDEPRIRVVTLGTDREEREEDAPPPTAATEALAPPGEPETPPPAEPEEVSATAPAEPEPPQPTEHEEAPVEAAPEPHRPTEPDETPPPAEPEEVSATAAAEPEEAPAEAVPEEAPAEAVLESLRFEEPEKEPENVPAEAVPEPHRPTEPDEPHVEVEAAQLVENDEELPRPGPNIELPTIPAPPPAGSTSEEHTDGGSTLTTDPAPAPVTDDSVTIPAPPIPERGEFEPVAAEPQAFSSPLPPAMVEPVAAEGGATQQTEAQHVQPQVAYPAGAPTAQPAAENAAAPIAAPMATAAPATTLVQGKSGAEPPPARGREKTQEAGKQAGRSRAQLWALAAFLLLIIGIVIGVLTATTLESSGSRGLRLWNRATPGDEPSETPTDDANKPEEEQPNAASLTGKRRPGKRPAKRDRSEEVEARNSTGPSGEALQPLTVAQVKQSVAQYSPSLRQCNERERRRTKSPVDSRVVLYIKISPSGRVSQAKVRQGDASTELKLCVEQAARRWRFPRSSDTTELQTPFSLKAR